MTLGFSRSGPAGYHLNKMGEYLALQFPRENKVHLIVPATGELNSVLELPEAATPGENAYDGIESLHISPEGFAYRMQGSTLIGGKLIADQWIPSFESPAPFRFFRPFSTHCGFKPLSFIDELFLFGPTGDQVTIHCMNAKAQGDQFYSIEKKDHRHILTIRTLKTCSAVVSDVEKTIELNIAAKSKVSITDIFQDGQLVLLSRTSSNSSLIFVDLNSEKVSYGDHKFPSGAEPIVTESGELWIWDPSSKKIWGTSSRDTRLIRSVESDLKPVNRKLYTTLVHVDRNGCLYFINNSEYIDF
jgi:hypothetical protein